MAMFAVIASWDRREEADPRFMKLFGRRSMGYF
jgi:hypothetical protein